MYLLVKENEKRMKTIPEDESKRLKNNSSEVYNTNNTKRNTDR